LIDFLDTTTGNNFTCLCNEGYQGTFCDMAYCIIESCKNEGICITEDKPECRCKAGYSGTYCETNIDDCASIPCYNNGKCIDKIDAYECICTGTGFRGPNCESDIDECLTENISCGGSGTCINTVGSYKYAQLCKRSLNEN